MLGTQGNVCMQDMQSDVSVLALQALMYTMSCYRNRNGKLFLDMVTVLKVKECSCRSVGMLINTGSMLFTNIESGPVA